MPTFEHGNDQFVRLALGKHLRIIRFMLLDRSIVTSSTTDRLSSGISFKVSITSFEETPLTKATSDPFLPRASGLETMYKARRHLWMSHQCKAVYQHSLGI